MGIQFKIYVYIDLLSFGKYFWEIHILSGKLEIRKKEGNTFRLISCCQRLFLKFFHAYNSVQNSVFHMNIEKYL